ncbi:Kunitz-type U19-barytoxin-Tl1a [Nymphon striatum]|nr:Kunitz-type U19-barytoxin-Tl1a [Nymphon striatum]
MSVNEWTPTVTYATETVSIEDETTTQPSEYADLEPATADAPEDVRVDFKPPSEYAHLQPATADAPEDVIVDFKPPSEYAHLQPATADAPEDVIVDFKPPSEYAHLKPATADAPEDVIVDFKPPSEYADLQPATADAPEEITVDFHKDILGCDPEKCPAYFKHLPGRFCKYKDKLYSSGETVKLSNPCLICSCYVDAKNESSLSCNGVDCPSVFNPPSLDKDCITVSSLNQCCSKEVCGKEARETLKKNPKCEYQGKSYKYGKDFYPKPCIKCNCNEDWTGDLKNTKSCKPVQCDIEVSSKKLDRGCEPVYLEGDCCPSYYICPEDVTSITIAQKPKVCFQERDEGTGENQTRMFFFNPKTNLCEHFFFNGTGGNDNRFQSFGQCMDKCINGYSNTADTPLQLEGFVDYRSRWTKEARKIKESMEKICKMHCDLDYVTGLCLAHFTAYYFNKEKGKCEPFLYGGCGGNANNFRSMENCNAHCKQEAEPQKCVFDGVEYNKGDQLIFKPKYPKPCVSVKCIAPPHLTFIHEVAPGPPPDEDCVPRQSVPCDLVSCNSTTEVCVIHRFPCDTNVNCPVRAACLPNDPCELAQLECGEGRICKNLIPGCRLSPCPKMATCVSDDPCDDDSCNPDQRCITVTESCEDEKCAKKPVCLSKDCPDVLCAPDSVYHPFGQGDDNCPWCEKKEE